MALASSAAIASEPLWKAQREAVYELNDDEANPRLELAYDAVLTYDNKGNILQEVQVGPDGDRGRRICTYDAAGRKLTEIAEVFLNGAWVRTSSKSYAYDERTGVVISNLEYSYVDGKERPGNCYRRNIERNADGNITSVEVAVLFNGKYDPTRRMTVTYDDATGLPVEIVNTELTYNGTSYVWITGETYSDIVWHKTDGQITSSDDLYRGENLIASAHYVNRNGDEDYYDYDISVTYADNGVDYTSVFAGLYQGIANSGVKRVYTETATADGALRIDLTTSYYDLVDETIPSENYLDYSAYDAYGLQTAGGEIYTEGNDGEPEVISEVLGHVTYDETYGYPLTYEAEEDGLTFRRVEFSKYVDCSTLSSIRQAFAADGDAGAQLFDLAGRRVSRPSAGRLYIERRAGKTSKKFIR